MCISQKIVNDSKDLSDELKKEALTQREGSVEVDLLDAATFSKLQRYVKKKSSENHKHDAASAGKHQSDRGDYDRLMTTK